MSLLLVSTTKDFSQVKELINELDESIDVQVWPAITDKNSINFAVSWKHRHGIFEMFPNVQHVMSYGAGVDHLLNDDQLKDISISRFVHESLGEQISDYVLNICMNLITQLSEYTSQRKSNNWNPLNPLEKTELTIGVLGYGTIGSKVAEVLELNGFPIKVFAKNKKTKTGSKISFYSSNEFNSFLENTNVLVNTLPLSSETDCILCLDVFKKLKNPAYVINVGRGEHLVEEDLIYAIDTGAISKAFLDVFIEEPLPDKHPFWSREEIMITPHIAALTNPKYAAELIVENYKRVTSGMKAQYTVDKEKGY